MASKARYNGPLGLDRLHWWFKMVNFIVTLGLTVCAYGALQSWRLLWGLAASFGRDGLPELNDLVWVIGGILIVLLFGIFENSGGTWGWLTILGPSFIAIAWLRLTGNRWRYILFLPFLVGFMLLLALFIIVLPSAFH